LRQRKASQTASVRVSDFRADLRTQDLLNMKQEYYLLDRDAPLCLLVTLHKYIQARREYDNGRRDNSVV
jgi:hypothetical protein